MRNIFTILTLLMLTACSSVFYPAADKTLTEQQSVYRLNAGDTITVRIFDEPDLSGPYKVDGEGMIALPLAGKITVQNQTPEEAAHSIADYLETGGFLRQPRVAIEVTQNRPFYIMGEVEKAGEYPFQNDLTAYKAIAIAGGYTYRADKDDIVITREEKKFKAQQETPILPGDVVEIRERFF